MGWRRRTAASVFTAALVVALSGAWPGSFGRPVSAASPGLSLINGSEMQEWLSYIASDELQGRATYSAGLGLAAA
jgi:hypothetical protein